MIDLHDTGRGMKTVVTERGQVSIPAALRQEMHLRPGDYLCWERISDRECRVIVEGDRIGDPMAALGMAVQIRGGRPQRTLAWMRQLREGE